MAPQTKRATIYFDPDLHKALRLKVAETSRSITELVNETVREALSDDADDLATFDKRKHEPLASYEEMVKRLNLGSLLRSPNIVMFSLALKQ